MVTVIMVYIGLYSLQKWAKPNDRAWLNAMLTFPQLPSDTQRQVMKLIANNNVQTWPNIYLLLIIFDAFLELVQSQKQTQKREVHLWHIQINQQQTSSMTQWPYRNNQTKTPSVLPGTQIVTSILAPAIRDHQPATGIRDCHYSMANIPHISSIRYGCHNTIPTKKSWPLEPTGYQCANQLLHWPTNQASLSLLVVSTGDMAHWCATHQRQTMLYPTILAVCSDTILVMLINPLRSLLTSGHSPTNPPSKLTPITL